MRGTGPRLRDLGVWHSGGTPPKGRPALWAGDVPWISGKDFQSDRLGTPTDYISRDAARSFSAVMPAGSLAVLVRGMGLVHGLPVALLSEETAINQDVRAVAIRPDLDPRFVRYALLAARPRLDAHIDRAAHGTARFVESGYGERLADPRAADQAATADFLDRECERITRLDDRRHEQQSKIAVWFERWRNEVLGAGATTPTPLSYLGRISVGIVIQPARLYDPSGTVPCLRAVNVTGERVLPGHLVRISETSHAENVRTEVRAGDVVVVRSGRTGMAAVVPPWADGGNCVDLLRIRPSPALDPRYLAHVLNSLNGQEQIRNANVGAIQGHLNVGAVKRVEIPARPLDEQRNISSRIDFERDRLNSLGAAMDTSSARLTEYRDALITEAVTGQLDIAKLSDAQLDESAHAALEGEAPEVLVG